MPLPWCSVVDHERRVGVVAVRPPLVAGPGDELAVRFDDERDAVDEVDLREVIELRCAEPRLGGEVAPVLAVARLTLVELRRARHDRRA